MIVHVTSHPSVLAARPGTLQRQFDLELPADATAADLLTRFAVPRNVVVVINGRVVSDIATRLANDDNIGLLAPISGG